MLHLKTVKKRRVGHAGTHTDTMSVRYAHFTQLVEPTGVEFAHRD
jgi:phosphoketolase